MQTTHLMPASVGRHLLTSKLRKAKSYQYMFGSCVVKLFGDVAPALYAEMNGFVMSSQACVRGEIPNNHSRRQFLTLGGLNGRQPSATHKHPATRSSHVVHSLGTSVILRDRLIS
jgi:hypothetical protein